MTYFRTLTTAALTLALGAAFATGAAAASKAEKEEAAKQWASATSIEAFDICNPDTARAEDFKARAAAAGWPDFLPVKGAPASVKKMDRTDRKSPSVTLRVSEDGEVKLGQAVADVTKCEVAAPTLGAVEMAKHYGEVYGNDPVWWAKQAADGTATPLSADERAAGLGAAAAALQPGERLLTRSIAFDGKVLAADTAIYARTN